VLEKGHLNLQANTPVMSVSERDSAGWITVDTDRGVVRTRAVIHTTNRWASHLLPEFEKLILPVKGTVAAIKAPAGFIKHTGAQHWDSVVNVSPSGDTTKMYFHTDVLHRITTYSCLLPTT
jgi:glycine/D-amino acid oxidase-like deaminating enzyme